MSTARRGISFGSLFAGIGGMDLGLERAGLECKWQVEIDPFCRKVLAKHWPDVPKHDDVRTFPDGDPDEFRVDLVAGGFPCQDISLAGKGIGIEGSRSGLWSEFFRVVCLLRPGYVLVENTPGLLARGFGRVVGDLAKIGYDAEWQSVSAGGLGAPHERDRLFIVAYPNGVDGDRREIYRGAKLETTPEEPTQWLSIGCRQRVIDGQGIGRTRWLPNSGICRSVDVITAEVDRLRTCGNSVTPVQAEWIGRRIMEAAS